MNDRYIFLDIDEVLNSVSYRLRYYEQYQRPALTKADEIDVHALAWFNYACKALNCKVILHSTWRTGFPESQLNNSEQSTLFYQQFFQQLGGTFELIDVTSFEARGPDKGAFQYIEEHGLNPKNVIIVDDTNPPDNSPCFWISPDGFHGFTVKHVYQMINYWEPEHIFVRAYHDHQPYFD